MKTPQIKFLLLSISLMGLLISCVTEDLIKREYFLENDSEGSINILFFYPDNKFNPQLSTTLENGKSLRARIDQSSFDDEETDLVNAYYADSVRIVFNREKVLVYTFDYSNFEFSNPQSRNVLKHSNYELIGEQKFRFVITEEDFDNATSCDGDCD